MPALSPSVREAHRQPRCSAARSSLPANPCRHGPARHVRAWTGEPGTAGTVAVVGAGKMGLPLAAQFASHGWTVIAVDIDPAVVGGDQRGPLAHRRGARGRRARRRGASRPVGCGPPWTAPRRPREADVVVLIVPVMLDDEIAAGPPVDGCRRRRRSRPGLHAGSTVIFETTLPVGDTRGRYAPRLAEASGLTLEEDLFVAFSPERLYSGAALRNLATYPEARRRAGRRPRPPARRPSTTASWMPRSSRCRRPRRPSSRSSPTRPTAT